MAFFLGIDGGGTGCRAALADSTGRICGRGTGGPANINTDVQRAADSIMEATRQAIADSNADLRALIATLGLAGGTMQNAARQLAELLPFARVQIVNDGLTAARGALGADDGILVALGTGSVFAVQRGEQIRQTGGRGFLLGDEGSGAVLGRTLMAEAIRAEDGFAPMTPLLREILETHGGIEGIIAFGNTAHPVDFGALAPRIVASSDPAAQRIFADAVAQIHARIDILQAGDSLPVVFVGGLGPFYAARLQGLWPIRPALGNSVDGAVAMARQMEVPA